MIILNDIPKTFKDELLDAVAEKSAIAQLAPTIRIDLGDNLMQLSLANDPAEIITGTTNSNLPGETEVKPVLGDNQFAAARAYKFAKIIPVSAEYMYKLPRLFDAILGAAPDSIALGVDKVAFQANAAVTNFAAFNYNAGAIAPLAAPSANPPELYDYLAAAFGSVAAAGYAPNGIVGSPAFAVDIMTAQDGNGRPIFGTGADGVSRVFGAEVVKSSLLNASIEEGTGKIPYAVVGDWTKARLGIMDEIRIKILEEAMLDDGNGGYINLAQQNMVGVLVEGWAAFAAATGAFARIGGDDQ